MTCYVCPECKAAGWLIRLQPPEQPHYCPRCQRSHSFALQQDNWDLNHIRASEAAEQPRARWGGD